MNESEIHSLKDVSADDFLRESILQMMQKKESVEFCLHYTDVTINIRLELVSVIKIDPTAH